MPPRPAGAARRPLAALLEFLRTESAGGVMLLAASAAALLWVNGSGAGGYARLLAWPLRTGARALPVTLQGWVNDGLMSLFFLVVSLEIRREVIEGELASWRRVATPLVAALGGVLVPALTFLAIAGGDVALRRGWAIPVATDIAFSLAVLSLLGRRAPVALKLFLTTLAILDDLLAILIIALCYAGSLAPLALLGAALIWALVFLAGRAGLRHPLALLPGFCLLWVVVCRSGLHPTLAGVAFALAVPADRRDGEASSPARRLERGLHWFVALCVLPAFGLVNAGLALGDAPLGWQADRLALGIAVALLVGKPLGVLGALAIARAFGVARLPGRVTRAQLCGGAMLCGIGFTMSLFIGGLAFPGPERSAAVKLGVFGASLLASGLGAGVLWVAGRGRPAARVAAAEPVR